MIKIADITEIKGCAPNEKVLLTAYISELEYRTSPKTSYIQGMLIKKGKIPFKIWSGKLYDTLKEGGFTAGVYEIQGSINDYNNTRSIIIDSMTQLEGVPAEHYLETPYNQAELWEEVKNLAAQLTPEAMEIFKAILKVDVDGVMLTRRFRTSTAAKAMHDAVPMGLMAHSVKVAQLALNMLSPYYTQINERVDKDLIILGGLLHDIGKVLEYDGMGMSNRGHYLSHHTFSLELIMPLRDLIIEKKGPEFYDRFLSILVQHHGIYGERPRTLEALLIHLADCTESHLTILNDEIKNNPDNISISMSEKFKLC